MKKVFPLIVVVITLVGCNNNNTNDETESSQSEEDELIVEQEDLNNHESNENNNKESTNENNDFEVMLEEFLIDSYELSSFNEFRHTESILSEELLDTMYENQQSSEVHFESDDREVKEFELYSSTDNPNIYLYRTVLEIDSTQTEHYGEVSIIEENGQSKIENMREINMNEL